MSAERATNHPQRPPNPGGARALLAERAPQLLVECRFDGNLIRPARALDRAEAMVMIQAWEVCNGFDYDEEDVAFFLSRLSLPREEAP